MSLPRTQQSSTMTLNFSPFLFSASYSTYFISLFFSVVSVALSSGLYLYPLACSTYIHHFSSQQNPYYCFLSLNYNGLHKVFHSNTTFTDFSTHYSSLLPSPSHSHMFSETNLNTNNILIAQQESFFPGTNTFKEYSVASIVLKRL